MEATREAEGLLDKICPPRLEDAGLEDCALPPESIREAFLKAATAVRSSIFSASDDETEGTCVNDPSPTFGDSNDALVGIKVESDLPGGCAVEKGEGSTTGDKVVAGAVTDAEERTDKLMGPGIPEAGKACVDGLPGAKCVKDKNSKNVYEDEDGGKDCERPILAEAQG